MIHSINIELLINIYILKYGKKSLDTTESEATRYFGSSHLIFFPTLYLLARNATFSVLIYK